MSLVFFSADNLPAELKQLLEPSLRREVADDVNRAILGHQSQRREAAIRHLVRMRAWAEDTARESKKDLPDHIELGFHSNESHETVDDRGMENGHDAMITT